MAKITVNHNHLETPLMLLTGTPIAIITALIAGLICRAIGMDPRSAKPVILMSALIGFAFGALLAVSLPYFLSLAP